MLHIYSEKLQPATKWTDSHFDKPLVVEWPAGRLLVCECCGKRHRAANCVVQTYYDGLRVWCAPEKGCKSPGLLEAKQRREFHNRSKAQKRRWASRKALRREV